jgi:hypothetical protein
MADIKDQLIKDSYNYVLQCNFGDGIVYRIGGAIPVNPVFQSGLTVNDSFTYSNGTEQLGYVLTCDAFGNAVWSPVSAATPSSGVTSITVGNGLSANSSTGAVTIVFTGSTGISGEYLPLSGGTVSGLTSFNEGVDINSLTASSIYLGYLFSNGQTDLNTLQVVSTSIFDDDVTIYADLNVSGTVYTDTISATTYLNYPDSYVTGFSLNNNTIRLSQNRIDQYSAFTISLSAYTGSTGVSGNYLPLSGGTLTGGVIFQNGLTANTISATTFYNLPVSAVTNGTGISASTSNGTVTITNIAPDQTVTISGGTGITTGGTYPNFTIVNSAPDRTVIITGGTNIEITGTYPDFGVNYTGLTTIQGITGITGTSGVSASTTDYLTTIINTAPDRTVTLSGGTNIGVLGTYPDFSISFTGSIPTQGITAITATNGVSANTINNTTTIINTAPDQTVTISGGTGITTGGTYPNFTIVNSAPDRTVTITGGTNIQIVSNYPNFGVNFTGSTNGEYLPLSGGTVTGGTIFQSGLTANTISATTYYNLPKDIYVTGGTYTSGSATFTNTTGGTFTVTGFAVGGGGGQLFYLNLSQTQNGNRLLSTTASTASEQTSGVTINNGVTGTIASFQSQPLNITLLPGGIWSFYLHSYKQNTNAVFNIFVELYKITSGGTQTLLFATDPAPVTTNSPNPSMQLTDGYFSGTTLSISDSVVAVVRATNTGNQSHTITLVTEGSAHYSYVVSTIPTQQGLTCDTLSGCSIIQTIQTNITNKFDKSGGTVSGATNFTGGLTVNTISATTYLNYPDSYVTGFSLNNNTITLSQNRIDSYSSFTISLSAYTGSTGVSGDYLPLSGGTVTGATNFTGGLTANTISATTYQNLPVSGLTGGDNISVTGSNGNFTISFTGTTGSNFTGGTVSGATNFTNGLTANTISATTYQNLPVSAVTNGDGISASTSGGVVTITNTRPQGITGVTGTDGLSSNTTNFITTIINIDKGSSQNIFKNIRIGGITQFTAGSNNSNLNFSGVNITITSADTNTLVFTNAGVTSITAGYGLSANTTTDGVTIIQVFDYGKAYTTGNNLNYI